MIAFAVIASIQKKQIKILLGLSVLLFAILFVKSAAVGRTLQSLNKINPFYSDTVTIITEENKTRIGGSDSMAIRRVVWQGALELGKKYPFFGTGVETSSEADFLYNKAHNEYLNFLATTGFLGLFAYLFLIFSSLRVLYSNLPKRFSAELSAEKLSANPSLLDRHASLAMTDLRSPLILGFISILITNYFGFSVVNVALFFFLFPAIFLSHLGTNKIISKKINLNQSLGILLVLGTALWLFLGVRRMWLADLAYTGGRSNLSKDLLAVKLNPKEPLYLAQLGNIQAMVATQIIDPQIKEMTASTSADLREKANSYLTQYTKDALENVNKAVSMNKFNLNLLKTKARTELTLASLDPKYNLEAIQTMLKLTELSPTEASNYYNIGILYTSIDKNDEAKLAFQKAIELKPDYQAAKDRLNLLK
ncbi:MAG: hypothetical protein UV68_C0017G0003 [Candidatus Collierbacteria bacterium GW2011_GWC2_43_12]|uniref:O-antigen ligase-related domain-containing protein n=1 Tax=Candidatus Collierbacteria bacterium GW2011_GWC2_43_12 TaxID=1618390 RepID=A0A0G1D776_9BACT|nr:MAG: hypothetical protein UV68_C0017G0003 [Candidatus Collierbacteria bacterium GW2011_GWC2_43_12]